MLKILDYLSYSLMVILLFLIASQNFFWIDSLEKLYDYSSTLVFIYVGIRLARYLVYKNESKKIYNE